MKATASLSLALGIATIGLATGARAQNEQWLQYHTDSQISSYRWVEVTNKAPMGVKLPRLEEMARFGRWETPLDPSGGRWLCMDLTRNSGPCNRIFLDTNGDGQLEDETPLTVRQSDPYSIMFEPARVTFQGADGPIVYHISLRSMRYGDDDLRLLASSGCYYQGKVDLGGRKQGIKLMDANVNGTFDDRSPDPFQCDRVEVEGDEAGWRFLGRLLEVGETPYQIEVSRDGAFVKLSKATGITSAEVGVPNTISEFVAFGENGHFVRKPASGIVTLPEGQYRIFSWSVARQDNENQEWRITGRGFGDAGHFEVARAAKPRLGIGEPIRTALSFRESNRQVSFSLRLEGALGEQIDIYRGNTRPPGPKLTLVSADGTFRETNTFEFG